MNYSRTTVVDASVTGDSVKQAILDLDADLSLSFSHLNQLGAIAALKVAAADKDVPNGVAGLDSSGLIKAAQIPSQAKPPVGTVMLWPTGSAPADYLECNGAALSTTDYPDLYSVIGYAYGGLGSSFNLPDWRGRFPRAWDHGAGIDPNADERSGGDTVGSTQADELGSHRHIVGNWFTNSAGTSNGVHNDLTGDVNYSSYTGGDETRPLNMAVMFCIKWR